MFETAERKPSFRVIKLLPIAIVVVAAVIGAVAYFGNSDSHTEAELTDVLRPGDPTFEWYRKYLTLDRPKASLAISFSGNRAVLFSGVVRNEGEKTLDVVEIQLTLFNYDEQIWETIRTPVKPGPYTPPIHPLKKRRFDLYVENVPEEWLSSHAEIDIAGIRFQDATR